MRNMEMRVTFEGPPVARCVTRGDGCVLEQGGGGAGVRGEVIAAAESVCEHGVQFRRQTVLDNYFYVPAGYGVHRLNGAVQKIA